MFSYLLRNNNLSENQSDFKLSDSCINQLLAITREIYLNFDENYEVRGVFFDINFQEGMT